MDNKGQISMEMIIVIAAVLLVAIIFIKSLKGTNKKLIKKESSITNNVVKQLK